MEQFDDILRTFTNEMNKLESRFGKIRNEEKMLAVKKSMPESLLNCRFRGTTMSYGEHIIALENIIVDKVSTVPSSKSRRNDTSAPVEIAMAVAAKEDGENVSQAGDQRILDLALQAVYKGTGKGKWSCGKGQIWNEKGGKGGKDGGKNSWQKGSGKKGGKGQEKGGKGKSRTCWTCGKTGHIAAWCRKGGDTNLYATDEDDSENVEEPTDNEEDLQAWCLLEERENEQWQEVISRRNKHRVKKANQAPLLSVESSHNLSPKKIVEVKDKWVKVRVTMDSCLRRYSHVSNSSAKRHRRRLWPQIGSTSKTWVRRTSHIQDQRGNSEVHNIQQFQCCQTPCFKSKLGNIVVLDEQKPHIRKIRDGTVIKLDVNNGVYTMDMWICLDETGPDFSSQ